MILWCKQVNPTVFNEPTGTEWYILNKLSGLVVERWPAALEAGVHTQGGEPKNFQYRLSSAETQQSVDRMQHKARGCLVLSVLC